LYTERVYVMINEYEVYISEHKNDPVVEKILANLVAYNHSQVQRDFKPFILALKQNGKLLGGAECASTWDWMVVKLLWVDQACRKKGHGTKIIELIEKEAIRRKCVGVHLDTYSFQAKDFYLKLGYKVFGLIENHPKGHSRYYLNKVL
jgi:N-acetylglutamate synthase-like GNAT family acetyltransferase